MTKMKRLQITRFVGYEYANISAHMTCPHIGCIDSFPTYQVLKDLVNNQISLFAKVLEC